MKYGFYDETPPGFSAPRLSATLRVVRTSPSQLSPRPTVSRCPGSANASRRARCTRRCFGRFCWRRIAASRCCWLRCRYLLLWRLLAVAQPLLHKL
eukprot:3793513-Lingulodinium_polyedra.AAC.1